MNKQQQKIKKCSNCDTQSWQDEAIEIHGICKECFYNNLPKIDAKGEVVYPRLTKESIVKWKDFCQKIFCPKMTSKSGQNEIH